MPAAIPSNPSQPFASALLPIHQSCSTKLVSQINKRYTSEHRSGSTETHAKTKLSFNLYEQHISLTSFLLHPSSHLVQMNNGSFPNWSAIRRHGIRSILLTYGMANVRRRPFLTISFSDNLSTEPGIIYSPRNWSLNAGIIWLFSVDWSREPSIRVECTFSSATPKRFSLLYWKLP